DWATSASPAATPRKQIAGWGERVRGGERDPARLCEQHLDPHVVLGREHRRSTRQSGRRSTNAAMICWVASLAALEMNPTLSTRPARLASALARVGGRVRAG